MIFHENPSTIDLGSVYAANAVSVCSVANVASRKVPKRCQLTWIGRELPKGRVQLLVFRLHDAKHRFAIHVHEREIDLVGCRLNGNHVSIARQERFAGFADPVA